MVDGFNCVDGSLDHSSARAAFNFIDDGLAEGRLFDVERAEKMEAISPVITITMSYALIKIISQNLNVSSNLFIFIASLDVRL